MNAPCIISGSLVDAKNVGLHKSLRLVIDVPQERAMEVIEKLGWPTMANPIPVVIARICSDHVTEDATEQSNSTRDDAEPAPAAAPTTTSHGQSVRALRNLAQQAAILCGKQKFWLFARENGGNAVHDAESAAEYVRRMCDVETRADIRPGTPAEQRWNLLHSAYLAWEIGPSVGVA